MSLENFLNSSFGLNQQTQQATPTSAPSPTATTPPTPSTTAQPSLLQQFAAMAHNSYNGQTGGGFTNAGMNMAMPGSVAQASGGAGGLHGTLAGGASAQPAQPTGAAGGATTPWDHFISTVQSGALNGQTQAAGQAAAAATPAASQPPKTGGGASGNQNAGKLAQLIMAF